MNYNLQIFRTGTHTTSSGKTINFKPADLNAMARNYNPAKSQAPIVIAHPHHDMAPAFGWVKSSRVKDGALEAEVENVDPAFRQLVTEGKYKKISASFYLPSSPGNPSPGEYYLRHVGFLGATPPAIKGLRPVSFSRAKAGVVEFGELGDNALPDPEIIAQKAIAFRQEQSDKGIFISATAAVGHVMGKR